MSDLRRLVLEAMIAGLDFAEACDAAGVPGHQRAQLLLEIFQSDPNARRNTQGGD